jgi:hypothetical protein
MYQYFIQGWILASSLGESAPNAPYPAIIVYVLRLIKIPEGNTIKYIFLTPLTFCERLNLKQLCKRYSCSLSPMQFFSAHCFDDNRLETKLSCYIFSEFFFGKALPRSIRTFSGCSLRVAGRKSGVSRCVRGKIENFAQPEP